MTYGYRPAEQRVTLGVGEEPDLSFRVKKVRPDFYRTERVPVRVSLGCHVENLTMPVPDLGHSPSQLAGMVKRVAADMPPINQIKFRKFKRFVKRFREKYLKDLVFDELEMFEFEEWLENAPYKQSRKDELKRAWETSKVQDVDLRVKAFTKDENYPEFKHLRGIYSRSDDYKVRVGRFFKKFGDKLFATKWFIKKTPVNERPDFLLDRLGGFDKLFCTDFSQFEATFVRQLLSVELDMYRWSLKNNPNQKHFVDLIAAQLETNHISFKNFDVKLDAKRMSGEMNTSCGNGMMNMLMTFFILEDIGNDIEKCMGVFEGDDGMVGCQVLPTVGDYLNLGARIKIELPIGIHTASFCGNVFDPIAKHNVTNPLGASVCFGWTNASYLQASSDVKSKLLRVKSMSMLSEFPGCPILASLARYGIRVTRKTKVTLDFIDRNYDDSYTRERFFDVFDSFNRDERKLTNVKVHPNSRDLVEQLYGISVSQQLAMEQYLDGLTEIQPLRGFTDLPYHKDWYTYDSEYSVEFGTCRDRVRYDRCGYTTLCYRAPGDVFYVNH